MIKKKYKIIIEEIWWRVLSVFFTFVFACITIIIFYEELLFLLVFPFINLRLVTNFISTSLIEGISTLFFTTIYLATLFSIPIFIYQLICFLLPTWNLRLKLISILLIKVSCISLCIIMNLTTNNFMPHLFLFLSKMNVLSRDSFFFSIQLGLKLSDFVYLSIKIKYLAVLLSQLPIITSFLVINDIFKVETFFKNRVTICIICIIISAIISPPIIYIQLLISLTLYLIIELSFFLMIICILYKKKLEFLSQI